MNFGINTGGLPLWYFLQDEDKKLKVEYKNLKKDTDYIYTELGQMPAKFRIEKLNEGYGVHARGKYVNNKNFNEILNATSPGTFYKFPTSTGGKRRSTRKASRKARKATYRRRR